jgi:hypothetical protein
MRHRQIHDAACNDYTGCNSGCHWVEDTRTNFEIFADSHWEARDVTDVQHAVRRGSGPYKREILGYPDYLFADRAICGTDVSHHERPLAPLEFLCCPACFADHEAEADTAPAPRIETPGPRSRPSALAAGRGAALRRTGRRHEPGYRSYLLRDQTTDSKKGETMRVLISKRTVRFSRDGGAPLRKAIRGNFGFWG